MKFGPGLQVRDKPSGLLKCLPPVEDIGRFIAKTFLVYAERAIENPVMGHAGLRNGSALNQPNPILKCGDSLAKPLRSSLAIAIHKSQKAAACMARAKIAGWSGTLGGLCEIMQRAASILLEFGYDRDVAVVRRAVHHDHFELAGVEILGQRRADGFSQRLGTLIRGND